MHSRNLALACTLLALSVTGGWPVPASGQPGASATDPERFIGAFRLVSYVTYDESGGATATPYTEGVIMYSASGRMGVHLMDPGHASREDGGYIAYFGGYEVDVDEGVVRHLIEGSLGGGAGQRTAVRHYRFEDGGDTLILEVQRDDRVVGAVRWERHR